MNIVNAIAKCEKKKFRKHNEQNGNEKPNYTSLISVYHIYFLLRISVQQKCKLIKFKKYKIKKLSQKVRIFAIYYSEKV